MAAARRGQVSFQRCDSSIWGCWRTKNLSAEQCDSEISHEMVDSLRPWTSIVEQNGHWKDQRLERSSDLGNSSRSVRRSTKGFDIR